MAIEKEIKMKCLFCFSTDFVVPNDNYQPQSGEMIKCANCGKLNDYDSLMRVVEKEGEEFIQKEADKFAKEIEKKLKKSLKF